MSRPECEHIDQILSDARFEVPSGVAVENIRGTEVFNRLRLSVLIGEEDLEISNIRYKPEFEAINDAVESCVEQIKADSCPKWVVLQTPSGSRMIPRDLAKYFTTTE